MPADSPNLVESLAWFGTVCLGVGLAVGGGYIAFLKRVTPARIEALKEWDAAHAQTSLAKLEECLAWKARHEVLEKEHHEWKDRFEREMANLRFDLEAERRMRHQAVADLTTFTRGVLIANGYFKNDAIIDIGDVTSEPRALPNPDPGAAG